MIEISLQLLIIVEDNEARHHDKAIVCKTIILESIIGTLHGRLATFKIFVAAICQHQFQTKQFSLMYDMSLSWTRLFERKK